MSLTEGNKARMIGIRPSVNADCIPVGKKPSLGTQVIVSDVVVNATNTIYTVSANKTLYLATCALGYTCLNVSASGGIFVTNATDDIQYYLAYHLGILANFNRDGSNVLTFLPFCEIPAGYKVKIESNHVSLGVTGFIFGYEE